MARKAAVKKESGKKAAAKAAVKKESGKKAAAKAAVKKEGGKKAAAKVAVKKESGKKMIAKSAAKKGAPVKKQTKKTNKKKAPANKKVEKSNSNSKTTLKAIKTLLSKGKKQGYLTYNEINELLPEDMLSPEQIDETLMLFDENDIEVVDEKQQKKVAKIKKTKEKKITVSKVDNSEFGTVTDPVKMYLREMGLVTLLSREGEVEIAKKIEAGEQEVLRALLESITGAEAIIALGGNIENGALRPKYVLRDIDEGDTYTDEIMQTEQFLSVIRSIKQIHEENKGLREQLFSNKLKSDEQRRLRRSILRRVNKIFDSLKDWRLSIVSKQKSGSKFNGLAPEIT